MWIFCGVIGVLFMRLSWTHISQSRTQFLTKLQLKGSNISGGFHESFLKYLCVCQLFHVKNVVTFSVIVRSKGPVSDWLRQDRCSIVDRVYHLWWLYAFYFWNNACNVHHLIIFVHQMVTPRFRVWNLVLFDPNLARWVYVMVFLIELYSQLLCLCVGHLYNDKTL